MKRVILIFSSVFFLTCFAAKAQWTTPNGTTVTTTDWVGVNTTTPNARFHIQNGGFLLDYAPGESEGGNQDVTNYSQYAGIKFYFNPSKRAFRGGEVTGDEWNNSNVAVYSFAFGRNVKASYQFAFAFGDGSVASGHASTAIGESTASGQYATAVGNSTASGHYATAVGKSTASAEYSFGAGKSVVNGIYGASFGSSLVDGSYGFAAGLASYSLGFASTALGASQSIGDYSLSTGYHTNASGAYSTALGYYTTAQGSSAVTIGAGVNSTNTLVNSIANSLVVGFNSNRATLFVGPSTGANTFGKVGIGTTTPQSELAVNGTITAKAINLTIVGWPDYVFKNGYKLRSLDETEKYVAEHKHLPGVPSAKEIESNGLDVGVISRIMMEKIEEITLHLIEIKKENEEIKKENRELRKDLKNFTNKN